VSGGKGDGWKAEADKQIDRQSVIQLDKQEREVVMVEEKEKKANS
jgi:hypothetical protein